MSLPLNLLLFSHVLEAKTVSASSKFLCPIKPTTGTNQPITYKYDNIASHADAQVSTISECRLLLFK